MFKLYTNKSSLLKRNNRYVNGGISEAAGSRIKWWERIIIPTSNDDTTFTITKEFENKPYAVSNLFYSSDNYDWVILQFNNIVDIEEEFKVGREIKIPSRSRLFGSILTNQPRNES